MTVDQRERRELQEALMEALGAEATDTLMDYLPPVGWADVATKHDLDTLQTVLTTKIDETSSRIDSLSTETSSRFDSLSTETSSRIDSLSTETSSRFDSLSTEIEASEHRVLAQMDQKLRSQFYWTATIMVLLFSIFTAVIKLA